MVSDPSGKVDARPETSEPELPDFGAEAKPATAEQIRVTRRVHVVLGLVVAAVGGWLLYRSSTELPFRGESGEPGPGLLPVLLTICLIVLGLLLSVVWVFGPRVRSGEVSPLSFGRSEMGRALLVWVALVVCTALLEPLGFLLAAEVLVVFVIVVVERMRSIPSVVALVLLPPVFYVVFVVLLDVDLPIGIIWQ